MYYIDVRRAASRTKTVEQRSYEKHSSLRTCAKESAANQRMRRCYKIDG